jgi:hypothetical protein
MTKLKSYEQIAEQLVNINMLTNKIEKLEQEEYVNVTWEDWAYMVLEWNPHWMPEVVAYSETTISVVATNMVKTLKSRCLTYSEKFNITYVKNVHKSGRADWYEDYLDSLYTEAVRLPYYSCSYNTLVVHSNEKGANGFWGAEPIN